MCIPGYPKQIRCSVCSWKFGLIQTSNRLLAPANDVCPKCGAALCIVRVSRWEVIKWRLRRLWC